MNAKTGGQRRTGARRWLRWLWKLPLLLLALSVLQVLALRFVDPPFSAFMAARQLQAWGAGDRDFRIAYDWRDMDELAPSLPLSMIADEDQDLARHGGFDLEAIEQARASHARGGPPRGARTLIHQVDHHHFHPAGANPRSTP